MFRVKTGCAFRARGFYRSARTFATLALFLLSLVYAFGESTAQTHSGDVNCDFLTNSQDVIQLISYVFKSGPTPCQLPPETDGSPQSEQTTGPEPPFHAVPQVDTLLFSQVLTCDSLENIIIDLYIINHDPLYTFFSAIRVESLAGSGFIGFDSLTWQGRMIDSTIVDDAAWAVLAVDGVTRDWLYIHIVDNVGSGKPPLAPGRDAIAKLHFTVIDGAGDVIIDPLNSGYIPELGYTVFFQYVAFQFDLHVARGRYIRINAAGTGDLDCNGVNTMSDIILLANYVFKS